MKTLVSSLTLMSGLAISIPAVAEDQLPTEAFLGSPSNGRVVMDSYGNCVRTTAWSQDKAVDGCGKIKPAPVAVRVAPPPPAIAAPSAPPTPVVIASPPPAVALAPVVIKTKPMRTVTLDADALFGFNSAAFKREGQPGDLEKFAERARGLSSVETVQITGYTDSTGPSAYNQKLSERRADAIKDLLVKQGVDPSKITILGMGERNPVADNATREGRAKNRRVEILFKGLEQDK